MLNDCRRGDAQTSVQNAQRHPAMAAICHCICILQLAFNDYRMESKILRRVRYVMNILPSFSPYPSSSLPLTKTGKKGTARDNEQKKSKIMVAERSERRRRLNAGCTATNAPPASASQSGCTDCSLPDASGGNGSGCSDCRPESAEASGGECRNEDANCGKCADCKARE